MADIDIEKKNQNSNNNKNKRGLYIIIAILVIAFIVWWITVLNNEEHGDEVLKPTVMEQIIPVKPEATPREATPLNDNLAGETEALEFV